jgi:hypothetical protein
LEGRISLWRSPWLRRRKAHNPFRSKTVEVGRTAARVMIVERGIIQLSKDQNAGEAENDALGMIDGQQPDNFCPVC